MKDKSKEIDLGQPYGELTQASPSAPKKVNYPTVYIRGVKSLDLPAGNFSFSATGKVVSKTERTTSNVKTCDYEIEIQTIKPEGKSTSGLKEKLDSIENSKSEEYDD